MRKYKPYLCTRLHFPVLPLYADVVVISADQDDIQSVLFLVSAIPVAFFPPTDWQKPRTAADPKALSRWICWETVSISKAWAEGSWTLLLHLNTSVICCCSYHSISAHQDIPWWDCSAEASACCVFWKRQWQRARLVADRWRCQKSIRPSFENQLSEAGL